MLWGKTPEILERTAKPLEIENNKLKTQVSLFLRPHPRCWSSYKIYSLQSIINLVKKSPPTATRAQGVGFDAATELFLFFSEACPPLFVARRTARRWPTLLRSAARISRTFSPSLPSFLFPELRRKGGGGGVTFFPPQASHQLETDEGTAFCACTSLLFSSVLSAQVTFFKL